MKDILLILPTSKTSNEAVDFAIRKAKEIGGALTVLYILDTAMADEVFDKFTDIGFIGDKPSSQLTEAIMKEYRQRGYELLGAVQIKAMEAGVPFNPITLHGDFTECAMKVINDIKPVMAVTVRERLSGLSRYFSTSSINELQDSAPCEVVFFDED